MKERIKKYKIKKLYKNEQNYIIEIIIAILVIAITSHDYMMVTQEERYTNHIYIYIW